MEIIKLSENLEFNLPELPKVVSDKVSMIEDLEQKVKDSKTSALSAKSKSEGMSTYVEKKFCGITYKSGDEKKMIEDVQEVIKEITTAVEKHADAQGLTFDILRKLSNATESLFLLGCYNIAQNKAMIESLNKSLREGGSSNRLSESTKEQLKVVVERLMAQRNILQMQEDMENRIKSQTNKIKNMADEICNMQQEARKLGLKMNVFIIISFIALVLGIVQLFV